MYNNSGCPLNRYSAQTSYFKQKKNKLYFYLTFEDLQKALYLDDEQGRYSPASIRLQKTIKDSNNTLRIGICT
jgi:hypothetical protein